MELCIECQVSPVGPDRRARGALPPPLPTDPATDPGSPGPGDGARDHRRAAGGVHVGDGGVQPRVPHALHLAVAQDPAGVPALQRGVGVPEVRPLSRGRSGTPAAILFHSFPPRVTKPEIRDSAWSAPPSPRPSCRPRWMDVSKPSVVGETPGLLLLCPCSRARISRKGATWRRFRAPSRRRRRRGAGGRSGSSSRSGRPWPCGRGVGRPPPRPPCPPVRGPLPATAGGDSPRPATSTTGGG